MLELGCMPPGLAHVSLHVADGKHGQLSTLKKWNWCYEQVQEAFRRSENDVMKENLEQCWEQLPNSFHHLGLVFSAVVCLGQGTHLKLCPNPASITCHSILLISFIQCFESCTLFISVLSCILSFSTLQSQCYEGRDHVGHASSYIFRTQAGHLVGVHERTGHASNDAITGVNAPCLGWVVTRTRGELKSQAFPVCLCLPCSLLPSPTKWSTSPLTHKWSLDLVYVCVVYIMFLYDKEKNSFCIQSEMLFKIILPIFIAYFYSPFTKPSFERFPVTLVKKE